MRRRATDAFVRRITLEPLEASIGPLTRFVDFVKSTPGLLIVLMSVTVVGSGRATLAIVSSP